jgi:hypothetical protein
MVQMRDTEAMIIPPSWAGAKLFDIDLCDFHEGHGPELTMFAPPFLGDDEQEYPGGVLVVPLQDVLEEYLRAFKQTDGGTGRVAFVAWLRAYADRFEQA